jgi:hypothetical protein
MSVELIPVLFELISVSVGSLTIQTGVQPGLEAQSP